MKRRIIKAYIAIIMGIMMATSIGSMLTYATETAYDMTESTLGQRVFDDADLIDEQNEADIQRRIEQAVDRIHMDIVIVTTDDTGGKSAQDYADDYYDYGGFGIGKKHSGLLYLIDMQNREIWISTSGDMITLLTDDRIDAILDDQYRLVSSKVYSSSACDVIQMTESYYNKGIESHQYTYDADTGRIVRYKSIRWYEAILAMAIAFMVAYGYCTGVVNKYKMKKELSRTSNFNLAYRADALYAFTNPDDVLIDSKVSRRMIPRPSVTVGGSGGSSGGHSSGRSTTHHSSSGRSHGGGGRHF